MSILPMQFTLDREGRRWLEIEAEDHPSDGLLATLCTLWCSVIVGPSG
jgi:hypothetical protein